MNLRKVKYWTDVFIEQGVCFVNNDDNQSVHFIGAKEGWFHTWGTASGETVAIVENFDGAIDVVDPAFIKFTFNETSLQPINELFDFIDDKKVRQKVVELFFNANGSKG